jgi:hypothetical protein
MIKQNIYWNGVRHIHCKSPLSKYELCNIINEIYGLNIHITKNIDIVKNMTLISKYENKFSENINMYDMIKEQYNYFRGCFTL